MVGFEFLYYMHLEIYSSWRRSAWFAVLSHQFRVHRATIFNSNPNLTKVLKYMIAALSH